MFEDFASSGKGPGIIGIMLGTLVLAGFSGLGFAVYSGMGTGGKDAVNVKNALATGELTRKARETSISKLNQKLDTYKKFQARLPEIPSNQARLTTLTNEVEGLKTEITALDEAIVTEELAFATYRALRRAGLSVDILPPDVADLSDYKLVLGPGLMTLSDQLRAALANFNGIALISQS